MDDLERLDHICALVDEEHRLESTRAGGQRLTEDDADRLAAVEVQLDQLWDLLRQRRARRHAGLDPDSAHERGATVVENYEQ
jgi:hypothetical protein